jgi:hypothetical protein
MRGRDATPQSWTANSWFMPLTTAARLASSFSPGLPAARPDTISNIVGSVLTWPHTDHLV